MAGVAGVTGLEPAASCVTGRRSNQLSYTPLKGITTNAVNVCFMLVFIKNVKGIFR